MDKIIELKNLRSGYGKLDVLKNINIEVNKGEIIAILGWNGSGKSTCLKTIAGIVRTQDGEIWFGKERIDKLSPRDIRLKGIAFAMQNHRCFKTMNVQENLLIASQIMSKEQSNHRIEIIFRDFADLAEYKNNKAGELSGGMQQQLSIAMALIIPARILLLDEPSHGLDPDAKNKLHDICINLTKNGSSILMAEQNKEFAEEISNRSYWFEEGNSMLLDE